MSNAKQEDKVIRRDEHGSREIRDEIENERREDSTVKPLQGNVNRDRARGDWDRSGTGSGAGPSSPEGNDD
jgi:hypothetical protein